MFLIDEIKHSVPRTVTEGDVVCINDGEFHKVFNTGHLGLYFVCVFDGGRNH